MSGSPDLVDLLGGAVHEVAPLLLGSVLSHGGVAVRITEVEAYGAADDPGSHAHRGRTPRNSVMFGPAGRLYVYFTYGMHHCANVVCGPEGDAAAVLLRAGEVVSGLELARVRRPGFGDRDLARGPARLCTVLDLDLVSNGADLAAGPPRLELGDTPDPSIVFSGPRVGLRGAPERPWRFWLTGEPTVSAYRPATPVRTSQRSDLRKQ
ncbi:3-methyladenine DNA glycosylase [Nocardioides sp. Soil777]|uniref:DNA-3-methyladenine glycosylase n=1 Tax=Nocardioides sp. Soil777 TaxID=1736409 RepID=UPI0007039D8D|nr:DNA-3-methyladenine glycosylase [Nocardioides sp. Soil777]KRF07048.1 3-methyladenine DNA glycosylase [Nocardioides sp. Soil777]